MGKKQKAQEVEICTVVVRTSGGRTATASADFGDYVLRTETWEPDGTNLTDDDLKARVKGQLEAKPKYPRLSARGFIGDYQEVEPKSATALAWQRRQLQGSNN